MFRAANSLSALELPHQFTHQSAWPVCAIPVAISVRPRKQLRDAQETSSDFRHKRTIYAAVRRHIERTYLVGHRPCVRRAEYDLTVFNNCGNRVVMMRSGVCPLAQAFVRWNRSLLWEPSTDAAAGTDLLAPIHFIGESEAMRQDDAIFAIELINYFHVCSSAALYFAQYELTRDDRAFPRSMSDEAAWRNYLRHGVAHENPGWLVLDDRFSAPPQRVWLIALDPGISLRLVQIGAPICEADRSHGVPLRNSLIAPRH